MVDESSLGLEGGAAELTVVHEHSGEVDVLNMIPHVGPVKPSFAAQCTTVLVPALWTNSLLYIAVQILRCTP